MNQRTVVVHGATGSQGAPVVQSLEGRGWRAVGVGRATADLADLESLVTAYKGADAVVVQLPLEFDPATIDVHTTNVVEALRQAEIAKIVFNAGSPLPPVEIGIPFVDGRVRLAQALPAATVVGPAFAYMENLAIPTSARRIRDDRELAYPVPSDYPMPWLAAADLAEVIADVLDDPHPQKRQLVAGPEALTGPEAAAAFGPDIKWVTIDHTEYEAMLVPHLGPAAAAGIAGFYASPPPTHTQTPPDLVRGTTTLGSWASTVAWATR